MVDWHISNQGFKMQLDRLASFCRKTSLGQNGSHVKQKIISVFAWNNILEHRQLDFFYLRELLII